MSMIGLPMESSTGLPWVSKRGFMLVVTRVSPARLVVEGRAVVEVHRLLRVLVEGALSLDGVEVETHAEVVQGVGLEAAHLDVPAVPRTETQPEIVGVGRVQALQRLVVVRHHL